MHRALAGLPRSPALLVSMAAALVVAGCGGSGAGAGPAADGDPDRGQALIVIRGYLDAVSSRNGEAVCAFLSPIARQKNPDCAEELDPVLEYIDDEEIEEIRALRSRLRADDVVIDGDGAELSDRGDVELRIELVRVGGAWYVTFAD
jgi:hypothetical protein